ncbi:aromatic acid exporter family protein [Enterococcus gallinarum]|uniref:FUSC family protein n=1 Tax=Enterococcus TaxID=1350 RepID=UPI002DB9290F|nr:aromatic acid exporter family protein [Enterococcus gallinarum]MEB5856411.1 aromatic acid exporter family protein [Enterococcus gallinarum]
MQFGRFRLGMRTIKTAIAVMLCILLFRFLNRGQPLIAALSAVFSLRQDLTTTLSFGKSRVLGNSIGGATAIIYFFMKQYFHNDFLIESLVLPALVAFIIVLSDGINNNSGIISGIATMLLITLSVPQGESFIFALDRVLDTFIGTLIAIFINFVLRPPEKEKQAEIKEDLVVLKERETELKTMLEDVQEEISKQQEQK